MKKIKVLITAGGTREPIDGVRVITNTSTGLLGSTIASFFEKDERFEVFLVKTTPAKLPLFYTNTYDVTDVKSVIRIMEQWVPEMDVVIHAMAVSDFTFKEFKGKLNSNDPETFIRSLAERIERAPKILSMIRAWNPKCLLFSFKYEDGLSHDELILRAMISRHNNGCDYVIANDKEEMEKQSTHVAYILREGYEERLSDNNEIAKKIYEICTLKHFNNGN